MTLELHAPKVVPGNVRVNLLVRGQPQQWKRVEWKTVEDFRVRDGRVQNFLKMRPHTHRKAIAAKDKLLWEFKAAYPRFKPIAEPRRLGVQLYFETTDNNRDVDNFAKLPLDAFTGTIWVDDRQIKELYCRVNVKPRGTGCMQMVVYLLEVGA